MTQQNNEHLNILYVFVCVWITGIPTEFAQMLYSGMHKLSGKSSTVNLTPWGNLRPKCLLVISYSYSEFPAYGVAEAVAAPRFLITKQHKGMIRSVFNSRSSFRMFNTVYSD